MKTKYLFNSVKTKFGMCSTEIKGLTNSLNCTQLESVCLIINQNQSVSQGNWIINQNQSVSQGNWILGFKMTHVTCLEIF